MLIKLNDFGFQPTDPSANRNGTPSLLSSINPTVEIGTPPIRRLRTAPEFFIAFDRLAALIIFVLQKLPEDFTADQFFDGLLDEDYDLYRDVLDYHGNRKSSSNTVRSLLIKRLKKLTHLVEYIGITHVVNSSGKRAICTQWRKI